MTLVIDAGNTRVKWGVWTGTDWQARGALGHDELEHLAAVARCTGRAPTVVACSVAGEAVNDAIRAAVEAAGGRLAWFRAQPSTAGVRNGYALPGQLGADRWAALVGAWAIEAADCLVVSAGTATTVDLLRVVAGQAAFVGGVILPGFDLMRTALARGTARLPQAAGVWAAWPDNTDDAIVSGCLQAQAGAIERLHRQAGETCVVLLTGGNADRLAPLLGVPFRVVDDLVLRGLVYAAQAGAVAASPDA